MKIVVLAGGLSPERDVSLSSGALIANALLENGHEVLLLDLFLGTENASFPPVFRRAGEGVRFSYRVPETEPDLVALRASRPEIPGKMGPGVLEACREADVVFLALHGAAGENGKVQAALDLFGVPYTGTGYDGSLLAMDKDLAKRLMRGAGILTADWICAAPKDRDAFRAVGFPCVVKPCGCGSSIGVTVVEDEGALDGALRFAARYEDRVLVEKKITGREFSVGVLEGESLPVIEIRPKAGFYDYRNKYQAGLTEEICPAPIPEKTRAAMQSAALAVHRTLRLGAYSRVDFILDEAGCAWCLEANTLPGMTPTSLLPQEAAAVGVSYNALCERIARLARHG